MWAIPTAPVAPAHRSKAKLLGAGYGFYLEVPRPHLASLDDLRARWPVAVAVRVVLRVANA